MAGGLCEMAGGLCDMAARRLCQVRHFRGLALVTLPLGILEELLSAFLWYLYVPFSSKSPVVDRNIPRGNGYLRDLARSRCKPGFSGSLSLGQIA